MDEEKSTATKSSNPHRSDDNPSLQTANMWTGIDFSSNPRNWSLSRKWTVTFILSAFACLQALAETMMAPLQEPLMHVMSIKHNFQWMLINSVILVGVGLGPLIIAPMSEIYGRKRTLLGGSAVYIVGNTCCGFANTFGQMVGWRLVAGFGACTADALAGGVIADIWGPDERGKAFAAFMVAPLLGPGLGPIFGTYISTAISWRWAFWTTSIAAAVLFLMAVLFQKETYAPRLVHLHRRRLIAAGGNQDEAMLSKSEISVFQVLTTNLQRPIRMLGTQPIIQVIAVYMALLYGTMFLFLFMYATMWTQRYGQSLRVSSLNYISAAIGYVTGGQVAGHLNDKVYAILKARSSNNRGRPEYRVPVMCIGTILMPIGLLWWGWTGQQHLHWILPNIGCVIFTTGCYICSSCISVYIIDAYNQYAASAVSTNLVLRSLFAAFFPVFAPKMFDALGFGLSSTILAGAFSVVGFSTVVILWFCGEKIRQRSKYCSSTESD